MFERVHVKWDVISCIGVFATVRQTAIFPTKRGDWKSRSRFAALDDQKKTKKPSEFTYYLLTVSHYSIRSHPHYAGGIWKRNNHRSFSGSKSVFERLRFRDGLVWTEGQTPHIKLRFQIPTASCWRGLRLSAGKSLVVGNFLPSHAITQSRDARYKDFRIKVGKDFVTIHWKVTFFDSFSFRNYSLCEITVEDGGLIKQRRLPDMLTNLPDRIHLNGRSVNSPNSDPK